MANRKMMRYDRACKGCGVSPISGYKFCRQCRLARTRRKSTRCINCGTGLTGRRRKFCSSECRDRLLAKDAAHIGRCAECTKEFQTKLPYQRFCSRPCQKRASDRVKTRLRRAARYAAQAERFDPTEIFDRDAWRCQLCGAKTLRSKRGTIHPRAPELDHILPLSAGGAHTRQNSQCACHECNMAKGAIPRGQLLLFA